jgi:NTP pyrophosphatase (non-canonical NTP hydrolase)
MNLYEFSKKNRERCESPAGFNHMLESWSLSDWFTALTGELGEAANVAKKLNRIRDGIPGNKETESELRSKLARELADTFIYLDLLCQAAGVDLPAAVVQTFNAKSAQIGSGILYPNYADGYAALDDAGRLALQPGDVVEVLSDAGTLIKQSVSNTPWQLGSGTWVIGLHCIAGGYLLSRVVSKRVRSKVS